MKACFPDRLLLFVLRLSVWIKKQMNAISDIGPERKTRLGA